MTVLRQRMLGDMQLRGLAPKTQEAHVGAAASVRLAALTTVSALPGGVRVVGRFVGVGDGRWVVRVSLR